MSQNDCMLSESFSYSLFCFHCIINANTLIFNVVHPKELIEMNFLFIDHCISSRITFNIKFVKVPRTLYQHIVWLKVISDFSHFDTVLLHKRSFRAMYLWKIFNTGIRQVFRDFPLIFSSEIINSVVDPFNFSPVISFQNMKAFWM